MIHIGDITRLWMQTKKGKELELTGAVTHFHIERKPGNWAQVDISIAGDLKEVINIMRKMQKETGGKLWLKKK